MRACVCVCVCVCVCSHIHIFLDTIPSFAHNFCSHCSLSNTAEASNVNWVLNSGVDRLVGTYIRTDGRMDVHSVAIHEFPKWKNANLFSHFLSSKQY